MKAVVFHSIGDIRLDEVPDPQIEQPTDAIVRLTASAICGTDLHIVRGTMRGMKPGTVLGHEGVGIVQEVGRDVRNLNRGDRVVIPSTIACGYCSYCRDGYYSQCDNSNPNGPESGTAFFGGPESSGPFHGLQAEWARVPWPLQGLLNFRRKSAMTRPFSSPIFSRLPILVRPWLKLQRATRSRSTVVAPLASLPLQAPNC